MKHLFALQKGFVLLSLAAITLTHFSLSLNAQTAIGTDRKTDSQQTPQAFRADIAPKVSEYMDALVKAGWFSGSILIAQNGKVLVSKGYGMANIELEVANTPQTKFRVGSITKVFTAIAIMLLLERGKLSLQDSICKYVGDCPASWQPITIHNLLSHTSGLAKHDTAGVYLKTAMMPMSLPQLIESFRNKPADFQPGEKFDYNNNGYILLAQVIEKASGKSYEAFLKENIFQPLKMLGSGYDNHDPIIKNRAAGYRSEGATLFNAAYIDQSQPFSAGALYSTTGDLMLLDQALNDGKFLSAKTQDTMTTVVSGNYGYGWFVNKQFNRRAVSHPGGVPGFSAMITRFPDERVLIVLLSNLENSQIIRAGNDLAAIVFGEKYEVPRVRTAVKVDRAILNAYSGEYEDRPGRITTIFVDRDTLMLQLANTGIGKFDPIPMSAESDREFFDPLHDTQVVFVKDAGGQVIEMVLRINGREYHAKKIK
ncbi:MAG TPA: serine hydrolase [Pyrinomonadaceae bacterium]|nr:serine hydrolase [Pyrinomonadaceae bacterium]